MTYVKLALLLLSLASKIVERLERRKAITNAERELVRRGTEAINARLAKAGDARAAAERDFDEHGVRVDPNLRD